MQKRVELAVCWPWARHWRWQGGVGVMNSVPSGFLGALGPLKETVKDTNEDSVGRSAVTEGSASGGWDSEVGGAMHG